MADNFGLKLGIEGEKEFKQALRDINETFKVLGSELNLVSSQFDKQDKSVEALTARNQVLNKEIAEQQNKIALLAQALENATTSFGENDKRTKSWATQLNNAKAELNNMEKQLEENNEALEAAEKGFDDAEEEAEEFGKEVKNAGKEADNSSDKLDKLATVAKGLGTAMVAAFAAIGAAVGATVNAIGDCVDIYADFDDSMRQVAATMGMTAEEINATGGDFDMLAQAAKDAGASTRYTASDAADALNYLALAGYDAEKAVAVMPKVLNLAAAGGMDLAYASDLVTDSMSALGMSTEDLDKFMDQMAKTSQKSNTSVQQLGEAILVCAGTASMTGQDLDNVNTALGVLADNGIKGAEGGTHLRNILLSLSAPTDKGALALQNLGISVFDAQGNMKQLDVILNEMNAAMSELSQEEKTQIMKQIFNKTDIGAINALLESTNGRFSELNGLILDSAGAATEMANTMESGLAGTERSWASALEGLKIETGEIFASIKQTALTDLTGIVRTLTEGLANSGGDWSKIGESVGVAIDGVLQKINEYLPQVVNMAIGIITVLVTGISDNIDMLVQSANEIITALLNGITTVLPELVTVVVPLLLTLVDGILENLPMILEAAIQIVLTLADGIAEALPELIPQVIQTVITIVTTLLDNTPMIIEAALNIVIALAEGIKTALPELIAAVPEILSSIVSALLGSLPMLLPAAIDIVFALIEGILASLPELVAAVPNLIMGIVTGIIDNLPTIILYAPEIIMALVTGLLGAIPDLVMYIPRIIASIVDTFRQYDWASIGTNLMTGLIDGIGGMIKKVSDKIRAVGKEMIDVFKKLFGINSPSTVFAGFGKNLLEGLWNGIANIKDWLVKKIKSLGSTITDALKTVLGIHSPSTVFENEIGVNLGLGVGVGFEKSMKQVAKDMQEAIPTDFDISSNVQAAVNTNTGFGNISLTLHIENFNNNSLQDIRSIAEEISTVLATQVNRKAEAF